MKQKLFLVAMALLFQFSIELKAQSNPPDMKFDTLSMRNVEAAKRNYVSNIRGGGNPNATEQINIPLDKLKHIVDACAAHGMRNLSFVIIKIRGEDLAYFKHHNPDASEAQILGSQMLVIKVPRSVFAGAAAAGIMNGNPLMLSLAIAGINKLDYHFADLPFGTGDLYLSFGGICPPPTSCDTN